MNNIYLIDLVGDTEGHFFIMKSLSKIGGTIQVDTEEKKYVLKKHLFRGYQERFRMLKRVLNKIPTSQKGVAHFLTGDKFYVLPIIHKLDNKQVHYVLTLHGFPRNKILQLLLRNFARKISLIIVYSDYLKEACNAIGIHNVEVITHPSFYNYNAIPPKDEIKKSWDAENKIIISAMGGTRFDKGLDILLDSFRYIKPEVKAKILLNIAGRELFFKRAYIDDQIRKYGIQARVVLHNLTDTEFGENIIATDIMAIPYKRGFNGGASGPMTEAMSRRIPCIYPDTGSLSYYRKYHPGVTFEMENPESLANSITKAVENMDNLPCAAPDMFTEDNFIELHHRIYKRLLS